MNAVHSYKKIFNMKKLKQEDIDARFAMYEEAINSLEGYESADEDEMRYESVQKIVVIRQLRELQEKFARKHSCCL